MISAAGSGFSRWRDLAVTRWREDPTCDNHGSYIFVRDVASDDCWSAGFQPSGAVAESYEVSFSEDRAEFLRRDGAITTRLESSFVGRRRGGAPCATPIPDGTRRSR